MNILVIGSGGREHALAWALGRSPRVSKIYIAPGNAGTEHVGINVPIAAENIAGLLDFAQNNAIDLTVVGPEVPLAMGVVDVFQAAGLRVFGPSKSAARLEASKSFSKAFMKANNIPTADYEAFDHYEAALKYLAQKDCPVVVKADGLAAGKGVIVCDDRREAEAAIWQMMVDKTFGEAGSTVVIEERLAGSELSLLAFSDGKTVVTMPPARDHKRAYDGDAGPNTGGMGAYAPAPDISAALIRKVRKQVLQPVVDAMAARGTPYVGVLYAGLMLTPDGLRVLEFNCRFGDPETQVILPLLQTDLLDVIEACVDGRLSEIKVRWKRGACATVVLAAPGYPNIYKKGLPISGLETLPEGVVAFHAGTDSDAGQLVTSGGRVLAISATGENLTEALRHAYGAVGMVNFEGMHYRRDIGKSGTE